jgi:hypothetical protein
MAEPGFAFKKVVAPTADNPGYHFRAFWFFDRSMQLSGQYSLPMF